jgi:hypothetical protein
MKRALLALIFFAAPLLAQEVQVTARPVISTTTLSTGTVSGNDTLSSSALFGSVTVGQQVYGPGIALGATVLTKVSTSKLKISDTCTATATANIQYGYFSSAAYSTGDWVGFPFLVADVPQGGLWYIAGVTICDSADIIGSMDVLFFTSLSGSAGLDNAAIAVPATDSPNMCGLISLTTTTDLGSCRILTGDLPTGLALPRGGKLWARLIARSGATPTAVNNYIVKLRLVRM